MKNKKEKIIAILLVVGLIVVTGSISYAAFKFSGLGSKVNTITTGSITMSYTESSNVLSMSGALPTTDATGKVRLNPGEYFDFTVSSSMSTSTNINYEIAVEELDGSTMNGDFIKFYLTKVDAEGNEEEVMAPSTYSAETEANTYTGRPANMMSLYTSSMDSSETTTYRLRMYVSEEYNPQGDGGNLIYKARVNVYGLAGDKIEQEPVALAAGLYDDEGTMLYTWDELVNDYGIDVEKDYMDENGNPTFTSILELPGIRFTFADEGMSTLNDDLSRGTKLVVDNSVTKIGYSAFIYNYTLKEVVIPNSVTSIGNLAFADCRNLISINIPNSVTSISYGAFSGCESLTSITIPDSVTSIGEGAFSGCSGLTSITMSDGLENIGKEAFFHCEKLTSINIPNSVTNIGERAFCGCKNLTSVSLPNNITNINVATFGNCEKLKFITIPNSVVSIGDSAFGTCTQLTSINIPNSVTSIGNSAFSHCLQLTSITMPNSIESIGSNAFYNCQNLKSINYSGLKTEWNSIIKETNWKESCPTITVHCSDADVIEF